MKVYDGDRKKRDFVEFMKDPDNPKVPEPPSPEEDWAGLEGSEYVIHLTDSNFDSTLSKKNHALVAFYAPW